MVFECTGDPNVCREVAEICLKKGVDLMTINSEFDCHYGTLYSLLFKHKDLVYCSCLGDQPGSLVKLYHEVEYMGFRPVVTGICKGFMDKYQTPKGVKKWVKDGHDPYKVCSFADGTKLNIESAVICNCIGAVPDVRGMHGLNCTKEELVQAFPKVISKSSVVDYTMGVAGINQEAGIFIIAELQQKSPKFVSDMEYLKMGTGPHYLFFKDYHLCYFEAVESVIKLAEYGISSGVENKHINADVITITKRNMKKGDMIDGIGSRDVYGEIDTICQFEENNYVSVSECKGKVLKHRVKKDTLLTHDMLCK